jgi:hypothetical protein
MDLRSLGVQPIHTSELADSFMLDAIHFIVIVEAIAGLNGDSG